MVRLILVVVGMLVWSAGTSAQTGNSPPYPDTVEAWCTLTTTTGSAKITARCSAVSWSAGYAGTTWSGFTAADVDKYITFFTGGPLSSEGRLVARIVAVDGATSLTLSTTQMRSLSDVAGVQMFYGSDQGAKLQDCATNGQLRSTGCLIRAGHYLSTTQTKCLPPLAANNFQLTYSLCPAEEGAVVSAVAPLQAVMRYGSDDASWVGHLRNYRIHGPMVDCNFMAQWGDDIPFFLQIYHHLNAKNCQNSGARIGSRSAPSASGGYKLRDSFYSRDAWGIAVANVSASASNGVTVTTAYDHGFATGRVVWLSYNATPTVKTGGSGYGAARTGTMTWSGAGCTVNPVFKVTTDATGAVKSIADITEFGVCTMSFPAAGATTWTAGGGLSAGNGAGFDLNMYPLINQPFSITVTGPTTFTLDNVRDALGDVMNLGRFVGSTSPTVYLNSPTTDLDFPIRAVAKGGSTTITTWPDANRRTGQRVFIGDTTGVVCNGVSAVDGYWTITVVSPTQFTIPLDSSRCTASGGGGWGVRWHGNSFESGVFLDNVADADFGGFMAFGARFGIFANPDTSGWDMKGYDIHFATFMQHGPALSALYAGGDVNLHGAEVDCPVRYGFWFAPNTSRVHIVGSEMNWEGCGHGAYQPPGYASFVRSDSTSLVSIVASQAKATKTRPIRYILSSPVPFAFGSQPNLQQIFVETTPGGVVFGQPNMLQSPLYIQGVERK